VGVLIASPQYNLHASQLVCASDPTTNGSAGRIYGAFLNAVGEPGLDLRRWDGGGGNSHGTTFIQTNLSGDTLFYNGIQASNTRATSLKATLLANGKLLVGTASEVGPGGILQISAGITFPATQVASSDANTLDDYEEGTFTPTIVGTTTAGTGTYNTQRGDYIKIGRLVTAQFYIAWTAHTGTGNMNVSGLPFTTQNIGTYLAAASIGFVDSISMTAGNIMTGYAGPNSTTMFLKQTPTGGGASTDIPIDTSGSIIVTLTYIANA
jgi:hypothetical protein